VSGERGAAASFRFMQQRLLEGYGNGVTLLQLAGSANTVDIFGSIDATGADADAVAIDASATSNDTIHVSTSGTVTGNIRATRGTDVLRIDGSVVGDITLGPDTRIGGTGSVLGNIAGQGITAPGAPGGTAASSMTTSRFEPTDGALEITVFGSVGAANRLLVTQQISEGFPVADTGIAVLNNTTLRLIGTPLQGDIQAPILTTTNGLTGTFAQVVDTAGLLNSGNERLQHALLYTSGAVLLTSISPAAFDAVASGSYFDSLSVLDQSLTQSLGVSRKAPSDPQGFARATGAYASLGKQDGVAGFSIGTNGLLAGIDGPIGQWGYYALSLAQTKADASLDQGGGKQVMDTLSTGFSLGFAAGSLDIALSAFHGAGDVAYRRETGSGTAHGSTEQHRWSAIIGIGQTIAHGDWLQGWRSSLAYSQVNEDAFRETSSPGVVMHFEDRSYERVRFGLGMQTERRLQKLTLSPWLSVDALYHADIKSSDIRYSAPGTSGVLDGRSAKGFELRLGAGASFTTSSGAVLSAGLTANGGELASVLQLDAGLTFDF
ncbi:MAG: autotransporter domain-containing protein, partial [Rhodobacterales bacterium]